MSDSSESQEGVDKIEELATLLYHGTMGDGAAGVWFQSHKNHKEKLLTSYETDVLVTDGSLVPKLLHLLRECMLSQQWDRAVQVLTNVTKGPVGTSYSIWKCGLEVMQKDSDDNNQDLIRSLYNQMKHLCDLNCNEVVLDYLMYLLKRNDLEVAKETIQENIVRYGLRKEMKDRDSFMSTLQKAYSGLVWYVEWKRCQQTLEQLHNLDKLESAGSQMMSSQSSTVFMEMQLNNYSQKALACFETLQSQPGVWDIFIMKQVELLVYSARLDDAQKVLTDYRDRNPENPNSLKYLYNFYNENYPESEHTHSLLKEIVDKYPSDPLVLDYISGLEKDKEHLILPCLFKLLDYPCWQTETQPWKMLASSLEKLLWANKKTLPVVKSCWDPRRSWWPQYHFNKNQTMSNPTKFGVLYYKAVVAGLLCGTEHEFVRQVQGHLLEDENQKLKSMLNHCHSGVT